jgi:hypothetical protein
MDFRAQTALASANSLVLARFFCAGTVLMGPHEGGIDHGVFIVRVSRQHGEELFPDTTSSPGAGAPMLLFQSPRVSGKSRHGIPVR